MMRKFMLFAGAAVAALFTGCLDSGDDYTSPYDPIMPGIRIYNTAWTQTNLALDPIGVAIRLEMLLAEAEDTGTSIDELIGYYDGKTFLLKNQLLFGSGTTIRKSGEGVYEITYVGSEHPLLDMFLRRGTYVVDTKGVRLSDSQNDPWTVSIGGNGRMKCWTVNENTAMEYTIDGFSEMRIQKNGDDPYYGIVVKNFKSYLSTEAQFVSDWNGNFKWMAQVKEDVEGDQAGRPVMSPLSYLNLTDATFLLYGGAEGQVGFSFNDQTAAHMTYNVPLTAPLKWTPGMTAIYNQVVSGAENASIVSASDYDKEDFPSPMVSVRRSVKDNILTAQLTYNGISMYL